MIMLTMMSYIDIKIIMSIKASMACYSRHSVLLVLNQQYTKIILFDCYDYLMTNKNTILLGTHVGVTWKI